jgi:signal transduction histidine kinase
MLRGIDAIRDQDFNVKFTPTGRPETDQLIDVYNQMIDHLRQERIAQQEQHYFLDKLIKTSPTGILILDYDGHVVNANPRLLELCKLNARDLIRKPLAELGHPFFEAIAQMNSGESKVLSPDGMHTYKIRKAQFIDRGFPCTFALVEELTLEILQAEKRSYGKVIRMMAHEVNNSIGAVNAILDTALQLEEKDTELAAALAVAIERNEHLSHFMRNFADVIRLPAPHKENIDLNELLRKAGQLMEYKARAAGVTLAFELEPGPFYVQADAGQIEQVLVNALKNALESIAGNGRIVLRTTLQPRQFCIEDNGRGIAAKDREKLFTPFFSTKENGQGIGLTIAREVLSAHGWPFSLATAEDGITRFTVLVNR